jgi:Na+-transporting methylmalonyl-CoA/oxaloacetate decarboxylase gamma subunit
MATMSVVEQALVITVIGVVSIFAVLFVLWGLMAVLVRVTAARAAPSTAQVAAAVPRDVRAAQAAAVAVAVALALQADDEIAPPSTLVTQGPISPWQATLRGNAMSRRAGVYRRN